MKKHAKLSIAVCALLAPAVVMAGAWSWTNGGGDLDWANPLNWNGGVVPALDDTYLNNGDVVQINTGTDAFSTRLILDTDTGIVINSGATLGVFGQALMGNSPTALGGNTLAVSGTMTVQTEFAVGNGFGMSALTVNSGGVVNVDGAWLIAGLSGGNGSITVDPGATVNANTFGVGWGGNATFTMNGGVMNVAALIVANAAATTGDIVINGGTFNVGAGGMNVGGVPGTQTFDLNGGIVNNAGGFADGPNATYTIGNGLLILNGDYDGVHALVSGANWSYDDQKYVVDNGDGTITVTSIPEPATMGLMALFGGAMFAARRMFA